MTVLGSVDIVFVGWGGGKRVCITYSYVVNFHTLDNMELFNTDLLSLIELSLEKLEDKILEAEQDR